MGKEIEIGNRWYTYELGGAGNEDKYYMEKQHNITNKLIKNS